MVSIHLWRMHMALFRRPFPFQIVVAACQRRSNNLGTQRLQDERPIYAGLNMRGRDIRMSPCLVGFSNGLMAQRNLIPGSVCFHMRVKNWCHTMSFGVGLLPHQTPLQCP
ncbi:hypothetical protein HU200_008843 [Digitaria exilis]|uniref:Uncharacterized protein n=1 Tax=Digitaria exilis TaxID=1010633 RepID=A0A835FL42_9POAL|nr:hypothetical protein HU200_008843 [Digitaria exilis]